MAYITGNKALFFVTSPRTPDKMVPEVKLLVDKFSGSAWNSNTQTEYYQLLATQDFFHGTATGDMAFKSRDRINRSPKALGLVNLNPSICLTDAGKEYLYGPRPHEAFTKQLLKYQLHSPFHIDNDDIFSVKPYLELIRFINDLNGLTKTEIAIFVMQLIDYRNYDNIRNKILNFREESKNRNRNVSYKNFIALVFDRELKMVYKDDIAANNTSTRESADTSVTNFLKTKKANHNDYADASIRYLRATGLFSLNPYKNKILVSKDKVDEVNFICTNISPKPYQYRDDDDYKNYLFSATNVTLLTDDKDLLLTKINNIDANEVSSLLEASLEVIKDKYDVLRSTKIKSIIATEVDALQAYEPFEDVIDVFSKIKAKEIVEPPLFLEWNTWRAFTMLDDGEINGNFRIDDEGMPLYTAAGNVADIECNYATFKLTVEVTMSSGQKQYEMEGEPVSRHLGKVNVSTDQDTYCIFIAPKLAPATVVHYYYLHQIPSAQYGGKLKIIPLQLDTFEVMLNNAKSADVKPKSADLKAFLDKATSLIDTSQDENDWLSKVDSEARLAFR